MANHFLSISDLTYPRLIQLFGDAAKLSQAAPAAAARVLQNKVAGVLFYQTSTRTRLSFETAVARLGGRTVGFADFRQTRAGDFFAETLEDTVRIIAGMADVIILRHFEDGAARMAAEVSPIPVVNAGDGANEHPTQVLCDLWSLYKRVGSIRGANFTLVGDPACRVTRSMITALCNFGAGHVTFLTPPHATLSEAQIKTLEGSGISWSVASTIDEAIDGADVVWMIPFILPDFHDASPGKLDLPQLDLRYRLTADVLRATRRKPLIIHTGPRGEELDRSVDALPNCLYFSQASDAVEVRMALLASLVAPGWRSTMTGQHARSEAVLGG